MKKILLVLKHELYTTVMRKSFLLLLFLLPVVGFVVFFVVDKMEGSSGGEAVAEFFSPSAEVGVEGFVDESGVVRAVPAEFSGSLVRFENVQAAESALQTGEIQSYYEIPADYMQSGTIFYTRSDYNPLGGMENSGAITRLLNFNLLEQDAALAQRMENPLPALETTVVDAPQDAPQRDPDSALTFYIPYGVTMLFYFIIFSSASMMLNSVTNEKKNRAIEILMTSVTPLQMMTGKIVALGIAGLLQMVVWSATSLALLRLSGSAFGLPAGFQLPLSILLWGVVFFVLGYAVYASLMAGLGALVPNFREASQATFVIIVPLIIPLMLISALVNRPNSWISILVSLFPLTSPVGMMTRLAAASVPLWQILLAVLLLLATALLLVRSVAGMFRAQNLLSGSPFNLKVFFRALIGKE